jgi:hypothetical protein
VVHGAFDQLDHVVALGDEGRAARVWMRSKGAGRSKGLTVRLTSKLYSRSKAAAKPCPTPTQSEAMPRDAPVRAIWWISVVAKRAPLQPSG